jgi:hypothetical protein
VITFHGAADSVENPVNAAKVIEQFTSAGTPAASTTTAGQAPGDRFFTRTEVRRDRQPIAVQWAVHARGHAWSGGAEGHLGHTGGGGLWPVFAAPWSAATTL